MDKEKVDFKDIREFRRVEKIGEGTYAVVYRAEYIPTGKQYALKKSRDFGIIKEEYDILSGFDHPNIIKPFALLTDVDNNTRFIIYDLFHCDWSHAKHKFRPKPDVTHFKLWFRQTVEALAHMHDRGIIHADVKPQNILITQDMSRAVLCDFSLAVLQDDLLVNQVQTLWYRAPEVILGPDEGHHIYGCAIDVWSLGCLFFEMRTGNTLFTGDSDIDQLFRIFRLLGTPNDSVWPGVSNLPNYKSTFPKWTKRSKIWKGYDFSDVEIDLIEKMLTCDPAKRITAKEILQHPYFVPASAPESSTICENT